MRVWCMRAKPDAMTFGANTALYIYNALKHFFAAYPHRTVEAWLLERIMDGETKSSIPQRLRVNRSTLARPEGLAILRQVHCAI